METITSTLLTKTTAKLIEMFSSFLFMK